MLWISLAIPVFLFEIIFRSQFTPIQLTGGVYRNAPILYLSISFLFSLLFLYTSPRFFMKIGYKVIVIFSFLIYFKEMCSLVAFDYRINFGSTWQYSEIFPELVQAHGYFYSLGIIGLVVHYSIQHLLFKNKK